MAEHQTLKNEGGPITDVNVGVLRSMPVSEGRTNIDKHYPHESTKARTIGLTGWRGTSRRFERTGNTGKHIMKNVRRWEQKSRRVVQS